jgi:hypothetical protein
LGTIKKRSFPFPGPNSWDSVEALGTVPVGDLELYLHHSDERSRWTPWTGTQVTESENHPGWGKGYTTENVDYIRYALPEDYGGDFTTQKSWVENPVYPVPQVRDSGWKIPYIGATYKYRYRWSGAILAVSPVNVPFPTSVRSSDADLNKLGSTAIARCAPRNNVANLATTLIETYRDGLPNLLGQSLWRSRAGRLRDVNASLGDEYLNVQFGWKPLQGDIHDFLHGVTRIHKTYQSFAEGSGKVVRRRYDFPPTVTDVETIYQSNAPVALIGHVDRSDWYLNKSAGLGTVFKRRKTFKHQWFSGAFTYYVPPMEDSFVNHANQAVEVLGLDLNPEVLWEAAPWSWAVDWFTNVGDLIHNVNSWSADGLVLKYGYIMEHSYVRDTYTWSGDARILPRGTYPTPVTLVTETKIRRRATPFGFGLSAGLTDRQKTIAAALGLSRVR